jgi:glutathione S-transferase
MFKLLGRLTSSNVQKVVWLLDELGLAYEQESVGGPFGGTRTEQYLALNPNATVPTLITDEGAIWESNTILRYLASRFEAGTLYPASPRARAMVDQWLDWQLGSLAPAFKPLYWGLVREKKPLADLLEHQQAVAALMRILDQRLATQSHVAHDHFTLADIAVASNVHRWFGLNLAEESTHHLRRYYQQLCGNALFDKHIMAIKMT